MLYWNNLTVSIRLEKCSCCINLLPKILSLSESPCSAQYISLKLMQFKKKICRSKRKEALIQEKLRQFEPV